MNSWSEHQNAVERDLNGKVQQIIKSNKALIENQGHLNVKGNISIK